MELTLFLLSTVHQLRGPCIALHGESHWDWVIYNLQFQFSNAEWEFKDILEGRRAESSQVVWYHSLTPSFIVVLHLFWHHFFSCRNSLLLSISKAFTLAFIEMTLIFVLILSFFVIFSCELTIINVTGVSRFGNKHNGFLLSSYSTCWRRALECWSVGCGHCIGFYGGTKGITLFGKSVRGRLSKWVASVCFGDLFMLGQMAPHLPFYILRSIHHVLTHVFLIGRHRNCFFFFVCSVCFFANM